MAMKLSKAITVTGRGRTQGCETSRLPHFLYSLLTDGVEVKNSYPCNRPRRPIGLRVVEAPTYIFYTIGSQMAVKLSKAIPVTGRGRPQGYETSRLPHFLYSLVTDGVEVK
jgi:hypothetical protein